LIRKNNLSYPKLLRI